jgi:hypothetical protein
MNEERRGKIKEALKWISTAKDLIDSVREDEQAALDNLPEGLKESEQGRQMDEWVALLDEASNSCDSIDSDLGSLI